MVAGLQPPPRLYHYREPDQLVGGLIPPGRWGWIVTHAGQHTSDRPNGSPSFFREHLLEHVRGAHTAVRVSRLACTFSLEDQGFAMRTAENFRNACYQVELLPGPFPPSRHDQRLVDVMGEPEGSTNRLISYAVAYWEGRSISQFFPQEGPVWEWLSPAPLRVVRRLL